MKTILITGADGFIGKNLRAVLMRREDVLILAFDVNNKTDELERYLQQAEIVYHLAGVNRPKEIIEFEEGNVDLTKKIVDFLKKLERRPTIVFSSSTQAELNNPYGISKKKAEDALIRYGKEFENRKVHIYRLTNVFGKWCRPNYNSVVATFCYNISHGLDISIRDANYLLELVYIDDVVTEFVRFIDNPEHYSGQPYCDVKTKYEVTLGELARKIYKIHDIQRSFMVPDLADDFTRSLYATYLSYLNNEDFSYGLDMKTDQRGWLAELIKSEHFGQIFVSKTSEGVVRGNHYHDSKIEKFCVVQGKALIKLRHILEGDVLTFPVSGENIEVVDIPPGYTHCIENVGKTEMITIFWANQIFNPDRPDTHYLEV